MVYVRHCPGEVGKLVGKTMDKRSMGLSGGYFCECEQFIPPLTFFSVYCSQNSLEPSAAPRQGRPSEVMFT